MLSDCMILLRVLLDFFFCLGSYQLGLRYFTENVNSVFLLAVFMILEVYTYLNSVLLVFVFIFCFFGFFFFFALFCFVSPKGQAWVFDFRNQYMVRFLSQNYHLNFKNSAAKTTLRMFPSESHFLDPRQKLDDTEEP